MEHRRPRPRVGPGNGPLEIVVRPAAHRRAPGDSLATPLSRRRSFHALATPHALEAVRLARGEGRARVVRRTLEPDPSWPDDLDQIIDLDHSGNCIICVLCHGSIRRRWVALGPRGLVCALVSVEGARWKALRRGELERAHRRIAVAVRGGSAKVGGTAIVEPIAAA